VWPQPPEQKQEQPPEPEPPEEDESLAPRQYTFNPLQAEKELKIGNFYFKKGSYKAAILRYQEALKWNQTYSDAYLRLGDAHARLKHEEASREAYRKFLELEPDSKRAREIREKLGAKN